MGMTMEEKKEECRNYFEKLCDRLYETHEVFGSCNPDNTVYLIPKGTESEVTYYSKPVNSFRISDHWNWRANIDKCADEKYIQCYSVDMPKARKRTVPEKATEPRFGWEVCYFGKDKKYHCICGERYDRKTHEWSFVMYNLDVIEEELLQYDNLLSLLNLDARNRRSKGGVQNGTAFSNNCV